MQKARGDDVEGSKAGNAIRVFEDLLASLVGLKRPLEQTLAEVRVSDEIARGDEQVD